MADNPANSDDVKIHPPDRSLHAKMGNADLDKVMPPEVVKAAESRIGESADQFLDECLALVKNLESAFTTLQKSPGDAATLLPALAHDAFSAKTKAGFGGYDLVAALAKSLQLHCEGLAGRGLSTKDSSIIQWHIGSARQILSAKIKGDGGKVGAAILAELARLAPQDVKPG